VHDLVGEDGENFVDQTDAFFTERLPDILPVQVEQFLEELAGAKLEELGVHTAVQFQFLRLETIYGSLDDHEARLGVFGRWVNISASKSNQLLAFALGFGLRKHLIHEGNQICCK